MNFDDNIYKKYLKYKTKYLKMHGGAIEYKCNSKDKSHLCTNDTINVGLCVSNSKACNKLDYNISNVELPTAKNITKEESEELESLKEVGLKKGYVENNLSKSCYVQKNKPIKYKNKFEIPNNEFSIITLNIMGIYRDKPDVLNLMKKRIQMLQQEILDVKPDIMCFQEMSVTSFNLLYTKEISDIYKYYYEQNFENIMTDRGKDIEVFVISKYPIEQVTIYKLEGNLDYTNSLAVYEFGNLIVINLYLQAGSKKSPGQMYKANHYARCRIQELLFIDSLIKKIPNNKKIPVVLLGDFNFDLNGSEEEWPEITHLRNLKFKDSWIESNPKLDKKQGNTEETDINTMRWNNKLEEKHFRYDAILYKNLKSIESKIICNKPHLIEDKLLEESYKNAIIPKDKIDHPDIIKKNGKYELFISDHFGVLTKFRFMI